MQDYPLNLKEKIMKRETKIINNHKVTIFNDKSVDLDDDLPEKLELDWSKARPNPYASKLKEQESYILLEPDIQKVFRNSEEVNKALRAFINAIPKHNKRQLQNL